VCVRDAKFAAHDLVSSTHHGCTQHVASSSRSALTLIVQLSNLFYNTIARRNSQFMIICCTWHH